MHLQKIIFATPLILGSMSLGLTSTAFAEDVNVVSLGTTAQSELVASITSPLLSYEQDARKADLDFALSNMLMKAPFSDTAIAATQIQDTSPTAYFYTGLAMLRGLPLAGRTVDDGEAVPFTLEANIYQDPDYQAYFSPGQNVRGNQARLKALDAANFLQADIISSGAVDFISVLTDPFPQDIILPPATDPTYQQKKVFADNLTDRAIFSVAANALSEMMARRTAIPITDSSGNQTTTSIMQIMKNQCTGRVMTPQWHANLATASGEALLREIAQMQAFNLYMQYQQYRLNEQAVSLLSVLASAQAKITPIMEGMRDTMAKAQNAPPPAPIATPDFTTPAPATAPATP